MKPCAIFPIVNLVLLLASLVSSQLDPRWMTGVLPENEIVRIKESLKNINYLLFDRSKNDWHPFHRDDEIPKSMWQNGGDIKLIIHGYTFKKYQTLFEKLDEQNIWTLGTGYANKSSSYNVFIVDWTVLSTETLTRYYEASESTIYVGEDVAQFLIRLSKESYLTDWDKVHLLGFSLGAHTVGVVGAKIQELVGVKIPRITGLDPAGPNFENEGKLGDNLYRVLDKTDGKFVDIIHCNMKPIGKSMMGYLGISVPTGHVDFFPSGGDKQKAFCTRKADIGADACSHMRCPWFMGESLTQPRLACPCENRDKFNKGGCNCTLETGGIYMGDPCPSTASGKYYLEIKK